MQSCENQYNNYPFFSFLFLLWTENTARGTEVFWSIIFFIIYFFLLSMLKTFSPVYKEPSSKLNCKNDTLWSSADCQIIISSLESCEFLALLNTLNYSWLTFLLIQNSSSKCRCSEGFPAVSVISDRFLWQWSSERDSECWMLWWLWIFFKQDFVNGNTSEPLKRSEKLRSVESVVTECIHC